MIKRTALKILLPVVSLSVLLPAPAVPLLPGPAAVQAASLPENGVVVYQFHRRFRCDACYKLEEAINEALRKHFPEELKAGSVVYRIMDLDEEGTDHYEKKYDFFYNTVIVADMENGKETRFKNLEEVWGMVDNKEDVIRFLRSEVEEYL